MLGLDLGAARIGVAISDPDRIVAVALGTVATGAPKDLRAVAALVYQRRKHFINLFIWPSIPDAAAAPKAVTRQGYHLIHWNQSGMTYWAISDLNESELSQFVSALSALS